MWQGRQKSLALSTVVVSPVAQCSVWWMSQWRGLVRQPGPWQWRSRAVMASSLCWAPHPGFASYVQYFGVGAEDDAGDGTVTGDHAEGVDVDDFTGFGFVEASGDALEGFEVGVDDEMWFFSADGGGGAVV